MQDAAAEQRRLRLSIGVAIVVPSFGVVFGLLSGSFVDRVRRVVAAIDANRREIAEAIGGEGPQRWLTIDFTADPRGCRAV